MTIKERLIAFLKSEGVNNSEFARQMGLSTAYVGSMRKSMPEDKVERLCQLYPRLNRDWLLYGSGNMYLDVDQNGKPYDSVDTYLVPLLPVGAMAGRLGGISEGTLPEGCERILTPFPEAEMAIPVDGDSMEPEIKNGTILYITRINEKAFIPWGHALVLDTENGSLVKKIYPSERGDSFLKAKSVNPDYPDIQVPTDSIYGMYRILGQLKSSKML